MAFAVIAHKMPCGGWRTCISPPCYRLDPLLTEQDVCWRDRIGKINQNLFWRDGLHLNKRGCELLKNMYINAINDCKQLSNFPSSRVNQSPSLLSSPLPYIPEPPPYHHVSPTNPHINLSSCSYHCCHNRPRKSKKLQTPIAPTVTVPAPTIPMTVTPPDEQHVSDCDVKNVDVLLI